MDMNMINVLYNITLFLIGACVITIVVLVNYVIETIKYAEKDRMLTEELQKARIYNLKNNIENI